MSAGRILLIVFGSILGLIGLALMAGGGALLWANAALKGDDGYFSTRTERYRSTGRAVVTKGLDLTHVPGGPGRWADLRVRAESLGGTSVFVGIARREDVDRYLSRVGYSELTDIDLDPFDPTYRTHVGTRVPAPPADQSFWAAQVQGAGPADADLERRRRRLAVGGHEARCGGRRRPGRLGRGEDLLPPGGRRGPAGRGPPRPGRGGHDGRGRRPRPPRPACSGGRR